MTNFDGHAFVSAALVASVLACAPAHSESPTPQGASQNPAARIALFGDLHVHTALSLDAYLTGTLTGARGCEIRRTG